jgi:hypothetical protein
MLGVKFEVEAAAQQKVSSEAATVTDPAKIELKEFPGQPGLKRTPAIEQLERALHLAVQATPESDRIDLLVRNLAQARLEAVFGVVYGQLYGTQLAALLELEARRKVTANVAVQFYQERVEKVFPAAYANYGFAGWLGFLKMRGLVEQTHEDIAITDLGVDFVMWLRGSGLDVNKPL